MPNGNNLINYRRTIVLHNVKKMDDSELACVQGGKIWWFVLGEELYRHSDQVIKGFKKGRRENK